MLNALPAPSAVTGPLRMTPLSRHAFIHIQTRMILIARSALILLLLALMSAARADADNPADGRAETLEQTLPGLLEGDFKARAEAIRRLAQSADGRVTAILSSLLDGALYYRKTDKRIVHAEAVDNIYELRDALTDERLAPEKKRGIKKISINNALRGQLRAVLATRSLFNEDPAERLSAIENILKDIDPGAAPLLREALAGETHAKVRAGLETAIALLEIDHGDARARLAAIRRLEGNLHQQARNRLRQLLERDAAGNPAETDRAARAAAARALKSIESKLKFYDFVQTLFFGLGLGSVLALAAIGLAITFGVMGVINMAHGELIMLGAYSAYVAQLLLPNHIDYSLFVALPIAFMVSGLVGIAIQQGVIRFLQGRPLETLLATFGVSLILQQAVRSIFSPLNRSVSTPEWMSGALEINAALSLTLNRLYIIAFTLIVLCALMALLNRTALGLQVRAVAQNRNMARAMGVRSGRVDALTFGLGSGIAGVAGVALSQLTNVGPNLGQAYIVDSFMVVVFGGVGNLWGTFLAGELLGVINKFLEPHTGAILAKILILIFIILFIQRRPRGLFPPRGRAEGT